MTPKEKAKELVIKYYKLKKRPLFTFWRDISYAKKCALIAVNELIENVPDNDYWIYTKREIEKL